MRILSIDLGIKSLGTSISDENNIIAIPYENYIFKIDSDLNEALMRIIQIVDKFKITKILLGHPLRTDGLKSEITLFVEKFYELMKKNIFQVDIKLFDERFTTKRAVELLKNKYTKNEIKEKKDMFSAYVMLNDYLLNYKND